MARKKAWSDKKDFFEEKIKQLTEGQLVVKTLPSRLRRATFPFREGIVAPERGDVEITCDFDRGVNR